MAQVSMRDSSPSCTRCNRRQGIQNDDPPCQQSMYLRLRGFFYSEMATERFRDLKYRQYADYQNEGTHTSHEEDNCVEDCNDTGDDEGDREELSVGYTPHRPAVSPVVIIQTNGLLRRELKERVNKVIGNCSRVLKELYEEFVTHFKRIIMWEDPPDTLIYVLICQALFWGYLLLPTLYLPLMVVTLLHTYQLYRRSMRINYTESSEKIARFDALCQTIIKNSCDTWNNLRDTHPAMLFGCLTTTILFPYELCIANFFVVLYIFAIIIFFVPMFMVWYLSDEPSVTEGDGEITDFLPDVTEHNLQILNRAGESSDSPTPSNANLEDVKSETYSEEELDDLMMPSHEEEESDDEESDIEPQLQKHQSPNSSTNASLNDSHLLWEDDDLETELEGVNMPSHEEDSDDELSDVENLDESNVYFDHDDTDISIIPSIEHFNIVTNGGHVTSYGSSDSEDECNDSEDTVNIEKRLEEKEIEMMKMMSDDFDVERCMEERRIRNLEERRIENLEERKNEHSEEWQTEVIFLDKSSILVEKNSDDEFEIIDKEELEELKDV